MSVAADSIFALHYSQRGLPRTEVDTCDLTLRVLVGCETGQNASDDVNQYLYKPKSIAQIPVPVPTSSAFLGFSMGEK
jgi:hypothetical protein